MNFMKRISYYSSALVIVLLSYSGCNNINQMESVVEEDITVSKDELQASQEYQNFVTAATDLQELDAPFFTLVKSAIEKGLTTQEEVEVFFVDMINPENKEISLEYLLKLGHSESEGYYTKRLYHFNTILPLTVNELGNKFHSLTILPKEEIEFLFSNNSASSARENDVMACIDAAVTMYAVNLWNEGATYAGIVYQQTVSWCITVM